MSCGRLERRLRRQDEKDDRLHRWGRPFVRVILSPPGNEEWLFRRRF